MKKIIMCLSAVLILTISITVVTLLFKYQVSVTNQEALTSSGCIVDTLYPDETDCTRFYQCAPYGLQLFSCPSGLHFNPSANYCDWPNVAGCTEIFIQESVFTSTDKDLFSDILVNDLTELDNGDVSTILTITEFTDEKHAVIEEFESYEENKYTHINSYDTTDQSSISRTNTSFTNKMLTDHFITTYEAETDGNFPSSFTSNTKSYSSTPETQNLIASESLKISEQDQNSTNGFTSNNEMNNLLNDTNLEVINSKVDSTSSDTTTNNMFLSETLNDSYLTATSSKIKPEINKNYITQKDFQETIISKESSATEDILSVGSSTISYIDASSTNLEVFEMQTQPYDYISSPLLISLAHTFNSRRTTLNSIESSTMAIEEKDENVLPTAQKLITSQNLIPADTVTESVYTTSNAEITSHGQIFSIFNGSSNRATINETYSTIAHEENTTNSNAKEHIESNEHYSKTTNSKPQNSITKEEYSVVTDESAVMNKFSSSSTIENFVSTQKNITGLDTSSQMITNKEFLIITRSTTVTEKRDDFSNIKQYVTNTMENDTVNQYNNSPSTYHQNMIATETSLIANNKSTMSIEANLIEAEASTSKSTVSVEGKSNATSFTPQDNIKATEAFESKYNFAVSDRKDVGTDVSHMLTVKPIISTTGNSPTTSTPKIKVNESNYYETNQLLQPTIFANQINENEKYTSLVPDGDLLTDYFREYVSVAVHATTSEISATENTTDIVTVKLQTEKSDNIDSVLYTSQTIFEQFSKSTANQVTEYVLTPQEAAGKHSTDKSTQNYKGHDEMYEMLIEGPLSSGNNDVLAQQVTAMSEKPATSTNEATKNVENVQTVTTIMSTRTSEAVISKTSTNSALESYPHHGPVFNQGTIDSNTSNLEMINPSNPVSFEIESIALSTSHMLTTQFKKNVTEISSDNDTKQETVSDFFATQNKFLTTKSIPAEIFVQNKNTFGTNEPIITLNTFHKTVSPAEVLNPEVIRDTTNNVLTATPSNLVTTEDFSNAVIEEIFTDGLNRIEATTSSNEANTVTETNSIVTIGEENVINSDQPNLFEVINELETENSHSSTKKNTMPPSVVENIDKIQNIVEDIIDIGLETIKNFSEIDDGNKHSNKHKHDHHGTNDRDDKDDHDDNEKKNQPYSSHKHSKNKHKNKDDGNKDRNYGDVENNDDGDNKVKDRHSNSHKHYHGKKLKRNNLDNNSNESNSYSNRRTNHKKNDNIYKTISSERKRSNNNNNYNTKRNNTVNKSNLVKRSSKNVNNTVGVKKKQVSSDRRRNRRNKKEGKKHLEIFYKIIGMYKKTVKW